MPVTITTGKFQFSNKPPPKPKPPAAQFPKVITLSDGRNIRVSVPVPDHLTLIVDISQEIYGPTAPIGISVAAWVVGTGHYLMTQPWNTQHLDHDYIVKKEDAGGSWYNHVTLGMGEREAAVRFEFYRATKKFPARLRLDMNPRKLGPAGFKTFLKILSDPNGPFKMKPLVQKARVTRFDVAVDIPACKSVKSSPFISDRENGAYTLERTGYLRLSISTVECRLRSPQGTL